MRKKKHFAMPQGKGVGERDGHCKSTNKQLSLSEDLRCDSRPHIDLENHLLFRLIHRSNHS